MDLNDVSFDGPYLRQMTDLCNELRNHPDADEAIEGILLFIEAHGDADLGSPGPLVHFLEKFFRRGYEEALVRSIERRPTTHTIWMLNRIINGVQEPERSGYVDILAGVARNDTLSEEVRSDARAFLKHQS